MKIVIDTDLCEANAVCMGLAPDVFRLEDDDSLTVLQESPAESLRDDIDNAVRRCPRGAITLEG